MHRTFSLSKFSKKSQQKIKIWRVMVDVFDSRLNGQSSLHYALGLVLWVTLSKKISDILSWDVVVTNYNEEIILVTESISARKNRVIGLVLLASKKHFLKLWKVFSLTHISRSEEMCMWFNRLAYIFSNSLSNRMIERPTDWQTEEQEDWVSNCFTIVVFFLVRWLE